MAGTHRSFVADLKAAADLMAVSAHGRDAPRKRAS